MQFSQPTTSHSARDNATNCTLCPCVEPTNTTNSSCRLSTTPCFDYRTQNNTAYCAPASLCQFMPPCDNTTQQCTSNNSVCVVNTCCGQPVCLPLWWTSFCQSFQSSSESIHFPPRSKNSIRTLQRLHRNNDHSNDFHHRGNNSMDSNRREHKCSD